MENGFLWQAFIYLLAAVISVPIAKKIGLSPVLGYLVAGMIIGPFGFQLTGDSSGDVRTFSEFGVIMMLFLVGLELKPGLLWRLRLPILGLGSAQVAITTLVTWGLAKALRLDWRQGLALGIIISMSSTAIVLQIFKERGWMKTQAGQSGFSVLLFQDLAVIPILALMPLLAMPGLEKGSGPADAHAHGIGNWPIGFQVLAIFLAVAAVIIGGRFLLRPLFRMVAQTHLREAFTATALALVLGITLLMEGVGLSPALGTFLAGVVLADSEYRHELEGDIEPFKGLLLGLFFLTVGSGVDLVYLQNHFLLVIGAALGLMLVKFTVLYGLGHLFRYPLGDKLIFALGLCQIGEFAFVLLGVADRNGIFTSEGQRLWTAVVALTMAITPLLILALDRMILPGLKSAQAKHAPPPDAIESEEGTVIIAGFGRMGNVVGRLLKANGVHTTVLDVNPALIEGTRKLGMMAYYGDASRLDLLQSAGIENARLFIIAVDESEKILGIARLVRQHYPNLPILARATSRHDAYTLVREGHCKVYREVYYSALQMGEEALRVMGRRAYRAHRATQAYHKHNDAAMRELAAHWGDEKNYVRKLREKIAEAEEMLRERPLSEKGTGDQAWDNSTLRDEINAKHAEEP